MARGTKARPAEREIEKQIRDLRDKQCSECPILSENAKNRCVMGDGNVHADIMLVGEAPGRDEDKFELPFVGPVGMFLREDILPETGIDETELYFTNSARCNPPKNRTPKARELINCRHYLEDEIRLVKPKVIIAMGNAPMATMLQMIHKTRIDASGKASSESKTRGITRWRGKHVWSQEFNCWIVLTFHPSYAYRSYNAGSSFIFDQIVDDIANAVLLVDKRPDTGMPKTKWVKSGLSAETVFKEMWDAGTFAYDIETGGSGSPRDKHIIGCSFACNERVGYYMTWATVKQAYKSYLRLINSKKHLKLMHNGDYEVSVHREGMKVPIYDRYFDTMIAAHMIDENFGKSLKDLSWIHTPFGGYDLKLDKYKSENKIKDDYSKIPDHILAPYGGYDAVATYILWKKLKGKMQEENSLPLFEKIVMPVRRVMSEASHNGLRVDMEYARFLNDQLESAMDSLESRIYEFAGEEFNINSTAKLGEILYDQMGYEPLKRSKTTGKPSVDKESIAHLVRQDAEIALALSDRSFLKTMRGTHVRQALTACAPDGRVHTSYNLTGAVTGRASCGNPSLHNVPRDRLVRTMYIASDGHSLIEADLKSAELAYLAAESGEAAFIRAFEMGLDLHTETAKLIYRVKNPTEEQRAYAKSTNFALVYGMTAYGLSNRLGITIEEAEDFIENYFEQFPMVAEYMIRLREQAKEEGYVESLFRRRRRLPDAQSDDIRVRERALRQAQNSPIQSGAADYTYLGLVRLGRLIKRNRMRSKIVHTVHDCVIVDAPTAEIRKVQELIIEAFTTPVKVIPVTMQVEIEVGKAWGEHTETSRTYDILDSLGIAA